MKLLYVISTRIVQNTLGAIIFDTRFFTYYDAVNLYATLYY